MLHPYDIADEIDRFYASETPKPLNYDIHEIEFFAGTHPDFPRACLRQFPTALYWPQKNRWTFRVTDDEFAETVEELEFLFEIYFGELLPLIFRFARTLPPIVTSWREAVKKVQPAPVRYKVPQGDYYGAIAV